MPDTPSPRIIEVIGQRPLHVPDDYRIFNAPRPLYGEFWWVGDFISGIHYAAVNPLDEYKIRLNISLDAAELRYISPEEHQQRVADWFKYLTETEYPGEDFSWVSLAEMEEMYCNQSAIRVCRLVADDD